MIAATSRVIQTAVRTAVSSSSAARSTFCRSPISSSRMLSTSVLSGAHHHVSANDRPTITNFDYTVRSKSTAVVEDVDFENHEPTGDLFESKLKQGWIGENLVGKTASIRRVFGPGANAQAFLTCGGEDLARHASFDPDYETAKDWIQSRAIGDAVLSPILISGLVGALVEAAFPQTVPMSSSMDMRRPLIVGVEVCARVQVESVKETQRDGTEGGETTGHGADRGYEIVLSTQVIREQDDSIIAEGSHTVWFPSYLTM